MEQNKRNYPINMFRVCIDIGGKDAKGRVYSPMCEEEMIFTGIGELVLKMDKLFDSKGYPQAFQDKRSFENAKKTDNAYRGIPKAVRVAESILDKSGEHCTYDIAVESRRNTSWQGVIYDADGVEQGDFHGEMELLEKLTKFTHGEK
uniref:hypothetical protein n=1 Tax=Acetatifactor sp. TaxID=1872090 RepID=UPI004056EE78